MPQPFNESSKGVYIISATPFHQDFASLFHALDGSQSEQRHLALIKRY